MDELTIAIVGGLGGMLGWGFADFFAKKTIDRIGDVVSLFWAHVFGTAAFFLIVGIKFFGGETGGVELNGKAWSLLILFGALQAVVYLFAYQGFGKGQLAVLNPVFASYSGIAALISVLFFKEKLNGFLALSLILIFTGILLLNVDLNALKAKTLKLIKVPGFFDVAIAALLASLWTIFWDKVVGGNDWITYTALMYAFMTAVVYLIAKARKISLRLSLSAPWLLLVLIGLSEVVAYLSISWGFGRTNHTSIVALLSGAFSLPTIILARLFLKERISKIQTVGTGVIIVGIMALSLIL